ncbi:acyl-CoA thioesterase [Actibacterium pelagium]|uniref:Thioeseterase n=1 Tax=Actibacterium pelagium TaxID=2029103 RepID=A0A917AH44_9RHOB|nr:acyl-CoA thioesterase [Actibacterium pelagium]GGE52179.1 thioeseterase [Actibacterium pelagium]
MYPIIRFAKEILKQRRAQKLGLFDTHVSKHICWPWDIDIWMELNNGRTLTLFDMGRFGLFTRQRMLKAMMDQGWSGTVAGSTVRYRRRIRAFDRFEMRTRILGWDDKFIYIEQGIWRGEDCANHLLLRTAITDKNGLVRTNVVADRLLDGAVSPLLPDWVRAWVRAEAQRPWPPELTEKKAPLPPPTVAA